MCKVISFNENELVAEYSHQYKDGYLEIFYGSQLVLRQTISDPEFLEDALLEIEEQGLINFNKAAVNF